MKTTEIINEAGIEAEKEKEIEYVPESEAEIYYEDIDVDVLEYLAISELRNLAFRVGIDMPMSKTQQELIPEIRKKVDRETEYFGSSMPL